MKCPDKIKLSCPPNIFQEDLVLLPGENTYVNFEEDRSYGFFPILKLKFNFSDRRFFILGIKQITRVFLPLLIIFLKQNEFFGDNFSQTE